jgi:hypothetical protein
MKLKFFCFSSPYPEAIFKEKRGVWAVLRIRIRMILGLLDPDWDPLVRGMDPEPDRDPSITKQK